MPLKRVHFLLVGSDGDMAAVLLPVCRQRWPALVVTVVADGDAALAALRAAPAGAHARQPFLILLDLCRLPVAAGLAFLCELRQDPALRLWPVFVLGHAAQAHEIGAVYDFAVAAYLQKAAIDDQYQRLVDLLDAYLHTVEFPEFVPVLT